MKRLYVSVLVTIIIAGLILPGCRPSATPIATPTDTPVPCTDRCSWVEIDKMSDTDFPPSAISDGGTMRTLGDIFSAAGLTIDVREDDTDLTYRTSVSEAEIHLLMQVSRNPAYAESATWWSAWIGILSKLTASKDTLGIMFDFGDSDLNNVPREGCAVFYNAHSGMTNPEDELFLTSAHELGHVFNLHHHDWEGNSFSSGATIMSYSMTNSVLWRFSAVSQEHLTNSPIQYVKPGTGGVVFSCATSEHLNRHQAYPPEGHSICP